MTVTPAQLRAAAARTLAPQPDIQAALSEMGFVQADPIRAPARAQDLTLMQRVSDYRAGDLERHYPVLDAEEDMLPNYGFVPRSVQAALHPREVAPLQNRATRAGVGCRGAGIRAGPPQRRGSSPRGAAAVRRGAGGQRLGRPEQRQHAGTRPPALPGPPAGDAAGGRRAALRPRTASGRVRAAPQREAERTRAVVRLLARLYGPLPQASLGYLLALSGYGLPHLKAELRLAFQAA